MKISENFLKFQIFRIGRRVRLEDCISKTCTPPSSNYDIKCSVVYFEAKQIPHLLCLAHSTLRYFNKIALE